MNGRKKNIFFELLLIEKQSSRRGFSMVEMMVSLFIFIILTGIILGAAVNIRTIFIASDITAELHAQARQSMNRIAEDLRMTSFPQVAITQNDPLSGSDSLRYHLPLDSNGDGQPDLDASGQVLWDPLDCVFRQDAADPGIVNKEFPDGTRKVLANSVKSVRFFSRSENPGLYVDELQVVLCLEKQDYSGRAYSVNLTSEINMRN